jgi:hypothetical protein
MSKTTLTEEQKKAKRQEYMREYMRTWKAKKYQENPENIRRGNRSRYLKKTTGDVVTEEDKTKYGAFLHSVLKASDLLGGLVRDRPDLIPDVLLRAGASVITV